MLNITYENLVQSFRILVEVKQRYDDHKNISLREANANMNFTINGVLHAFHAFYNILRKEEEEVNLDWYTTPELCFFLIIRNAMHHNIGNGIRSIYRYDSIPKKTYFYVNFPPQEEGTTFMDIPISWGDMAEIFNMPSNISRLWDGNADLIRAYVCADQFEKEAQDAGFAIDEIFINMVPMMRNAAITLIREIKDRLDLSSIEAQVFIQTFAEGLPANTHAPTCSIKYQYE